jgi:hypothetical protein
MPSASDQYSQHQQHPSRSSYCADYSPLLNSEQRSTVEISVYTQNLRWWSFDLKGASEVSLLSSFLAREAPELLLFLCAGQVQLLDCGCHAVVSILGVVFQKIICFERQSLA